MNRLGQESSPYLRQHADNPVAWWPWGEEAFREARERDVPVLLSVGYSTCHWCHVMAHESFEDEATAEYMNAHFVNVKVDREERPDVDAVYMAATQALTGQGGWPMTVFLTPDGEPFYAGTYFPPRDGHGLPSFTRVMASVERAWREDRPKLLGNAEALTEHVREASRPRAAEGEVDAGLLERAVGNLRRVFDESLGGFGGAPKFPAPTTLDFLLTQPTGRLMALHTLRRMLAGGLHDQLGGGFHRYSVDEAWRVPHFEKMLYDNAQLTRTLLRAYQLSGDTAFAQAARATLEYLRREMLAPDGGFFSAQDADTGGVEGLTFTWTPAEVRDVLGDADGELLCRHLGIADPGNFLDPHRPEVGRRSVPFVALPVPDLALERRQTEEEVAAHLDALKARLLAARAQRPQPGTDDKVLTSWNGLALAAFADAARILREPAYLEVARRNAAFIEGHLALPDGTLRHTWGGGQARVEGLMEDHALYALGLVALFQAGGDLAHLRRARELWGVVRRDFWNEEAGVFMASGGRAEPLLARQAPGFDSAVLSENAAGALLALWMHRYFADADADADAEAMARRTVNAFRPDMLAAAGGFGGLWQAAALLHAPHTEVAIIGRAGERAPLEAVAADVFLPFAALAFTEAGGDLPVLQDRPGDGRGYVCLHHTCDLPTTDPGVFRAQLDRVAGEGR
ncbi:thioredoxin domain-containing protein [Deinococcus arenae]|uniref:Thioredoxin domain-containing protein n=1 Tax=Deinococcus arenae TaxID=1452751 RepID=A0A8H9GIC2_9DEIO|nr:thioredoxin domain-containing protein [Deinococcus arenae]AWT35958.1 thioredoxin domain-containing protein [Deinococcus actinosclerus]GGM30513.1 thioredoxin domain-containing protein [Deinococcus arenae]